MCIPDDKCLLLPDMALLKLESVVHAKKNPKKIIFSLRNDIERQAGMESIQTVVEQLESNGYLCESSSTIITNKKIISLKRRSETLESKISEFANAELVITDRLHSMVVALCAGTKCIAIDNSTHKITGVYKEWLRTMNGLTVYTQPKDITYARIRSVLNSNDVPESLLFVHEFDELKSRIER